MKTLIKFTFVIILFTSFKQINPNLLRIKLYLVDQFNAKYTKEAFIQVYDFDAKTIILEHKTKGSMQFVSTKKTFYGIIINHCNADTIILKADRNKTVYIKISKCALNKPI